MLPARSNRTINRKRELKNAPLRSLTSLMECRSIIPAVQQKESKCLPRDTMWIHTVPLKLRDAQANTHLYPQPSRTTKRDIMSKHTWFITSQFWGGTLLQVNGYVRTKWMIPLESGLLEKLKAVQLVKPFLARYEIRQLFTMFPRNHQSTLPWAQ